MEHISYFHIIGFERQLSPPLCERHKRSAFARLDYCAFSDINHISSCSKGHTKCFSVLKAAILAFVCYMDQSITDNIFTIGKENFPQEISAPQNSWYTTMTFYSSQCRSSNEAKILLKMRTCIKCSVIEEYSSKSYRWEKKL